jgi:hypothetical protein
MSDHPDFPDWLNARLRDPHAPLPKELEGIVLTGRSAWWIDAPGDFVACVRLLPELLGPGCTLCIEGFFADDAEVFFAAHPAEHTEKVAHDTMWPIAQIRQIPLDGPTVAGFIALYRSRASGLPEDAYLEIGDHFKAHRDGRLLFHWHDAFDRSPLMVAEAIPEERVHAFCSKLGSRYERMVMESEA